MLTSVRHFLAVLVVCCRKATEERTGASKQDGEDAFRSVEYSAPFQCTKGLKERVGGGLESTETCIVLEFCEAVPGIEFSQGEKLEFF